MGQQGTDLATAGIHSYDEDLLLAEGLINEGSADNIDIPGLLKLMVSRGNAVTSALASSPHYCWFADEPWPEVTGGGTGGWVPGIGIGGPNTIV